ncbi:predicted protein [Naegleria gruberi]|uniref:Predicted protein n=1 Tax=Naegleria gruberi TaxID=5762 RepID=D2VWS9_NAEGR|nr:uncharacterized protein NAEGRDRAFT_81509 [Naegleria gruberi]EFC38747.1 predicted protein [Naegleria gruberi]|eukprot:XP_002671491.1 predicted protein [Naegleria gruberi strain NEG-M]
MNNEDTEDTEEIIGSTHSNSYDGILSSSEELFDPSRDRYPYCIVWTPIPLITWFLPFVGHMGIANSKGIIHDFAGPYYISVDDFAFGKPTRYLNIKNQLSQEQLENYDSNIKSGAKCFRSKMYNFFCQNCHHYTVHCLNQMKFKNRNIGIVEIGFLMFFYGKYVNGVSGILKTWLPFLILLALVGLIVVMAVVIPSVVLN